MLMKIRLLMAICGLAGLLAYSFGDTWTFQYDRADSGTNIFHGLTYSSYQDAVAGKGDQDISVKAKVAGTTDRAAFVYWSSLSKWIKQNPALNVTRTTIHLTNNSAWSAVGTMDWGVVCYPMTTNLSVWPKSGAAGCETAQWIDWNASLSSAIVTSVPSVTPVTGSLNITDAAAPSWDFEVTSLMATIKAAPDSEWGFVIYSTGGNGGRINGFGYESYPMEEQTDATQNPALIIEGTTAIETLPTLNTVATLSCQPNPFTNSTSIRFQLPKGSHQVSAVIYDVSGKMVKNLYQGNLSAGTHSLVWNGANSANGVYMLVLKAGQQVMNQKIFLAR